MNTGLLVNISEVSLNEVESIHTKGRRVAARHTASSAYSETNSYLAVLLTIYIHPPYASNLLENFIWKYVKAIIMPNSRYAMAEE